MQWKRCGAAHQGAQEGAGGVVGGHVARGLLLQQPLLEVGLQAPALQLAGWGLRAKLEEGLAHACIQQLVLLVKQLDLEGAWGSTQGKLACLLLQQLLLHMGFSWPALQLASPRD